jgi:threonine dehydrogenase-like Zn-dependent dehydrogenase
MRAAVFLGPGSMEVRDVPDPVAGDGDVALRVLACGICGSDTRALATPPGLTYMPGIVFGHEFVGEVVGSGHRVVVFPSIPCGVCRLCQAGRGNLCADIVHIGATTDGGLAERAVVPRRVTTPVPLDLEPMLATLSEPLACVLNGARRAAFAAGDSVVIFGAGPIGLLFCAVARIAGCGPITVVEPHPGRAAAALELGADRTLPPDCAGEAGGADVVVDSVGTLTGRAVDLASPGGRVVAFGLDWNATATVTPAAITSRELTIVGAYLGWGTLPRAVAMLDRHREQFRPIASHSFGLEDSAAAVSAMARAESLKSVVMIG